MSDNQAPVTTIKFPNQEPKKRPRRAHEVTSRHYFVIENGVVRYADRDKVENAWRGKMPWPGPDGDVRILSAVFDETEKLVGCYFTLASVSAGMFTAESIEQARTTTLRQALETATSTGQMLPSYLRHTSGWPADWPRQVALALGISVEAVHDMGLGGPLVTSAFANQSMNSAARSHAFAQRAKLGRMTKKEAIEKGYETGSIEYSFEAPIKFRCGHISDYSLNASAKIKMNLKHDATGPKVVGEFRLRAIKLVRAITEGTKIRDVCEWANLEAVYETLFDEDEQTKEELNLPFLADDLLFIDSVSLDSQYKEPRAYARILEGVIAGIAPRSLVLALRSAFDNAEQWIALGFKEIPQSDLIVRHVELRRTGL